jgi:hypothetical protein
MCLVRTQTAALPCQILPLTEAPPNDLWSFVNSIGIIEWSQSNRADILTHVVSGIDWKHYKHPLPEHVYIYMQYWHDVELTSPDKTAKLKSDLCGC